MKQMVWIDSLLAEVCCHQQKQKPCVQILQKEHENWNDWRFQGLSVLPNISHDNYYDVSDYKVDYWYD